MANNINVSYEQIEAVVGNIQSKLTQKQSDVDSAYASALSVMQEFKGEEADALRSLHEAEKSLMQQINGTLGKLAESVRFAGSQFQNLDSTGAKHMS